MVRVFRYSGMPVNIEALDAYNKDWKAYYDAAKERAKLDMLKLNRFLAYGERQLIKKHGSTVDIEMPQTAEAWNELITKYGSPVMVAQKSDNTGVVLVVMDQGLQ